MHGPFISDHKERRFSKKNETMATGYNTDKLRVLKITR